MANYNFKIEFGRSFAVIKKSNFKEEKRYEYLDNFHRIYDPELDHKHGIKIEV